MLRLLLLLTTCASTCAQIKIIPSNSTVVPAGEDRGIESAGILPVNAIPSPWSKIGLGMLYKHGAKPDYLVYEFDFSLSEIVKISTVAPVLDAVESGFKSNTYDPYYCGDLVNPGSALVGDYGQIELRAKDSTNPNWRLLRNQPCCKTKGVLCPGCYRGRETMSTNIQTFSDGKRAVMRIKAVVGGREVQTLVNILCQYCAQYTCADSYCANGQVRIITSLDASWNV